MRCLPALVLAVLLGGCADDAREQAAQPGAVGDRVTVVVRPQGEGVPGREREVRCPADPECDRLAKADFDPPSGTVACTQQYGGPAVATVRGRVGGRAVDARFDLTDGCAIARWERFAWLLGEPPTS